MIAPLVILLLLSVAARAADLVYAGTYTRGASQGIYAWRFDPQTGKLDSLGLAAATPNPSFLAVHPNRRFLYAVNEGEPGTVSAFAIDPSTGKLNLLNQVSSRGAGPCHIAVDATGRSAVVANYGGGSIAAMPIRADGRLEEAAAFVQHQGRSVNPQRQQGPHAHCVHFSPDNRFVLAADLGLDQVLVYRFDASRASLAPGDPPFAKVAPGSGPRHLAFHPGARFVYVINEMASTITTFAWQAGGGLKETQTVPTLPAGFTGQSSTAEIKVDRAGKFLYGSNRGHDSVAVFAIHRRLGTLSLVEHVATQGKTPRNFALHPSGRYLFAANQNSDSIAVFRVHPKTGRLTPDRLMRDAPVPVCVVFVARG